MKLEKDLANLGIRYMLAYIIHLQTNHKIEKFHRDLQRRLSWFIDASCHRTDRGQPKGHISTSQMCVLSA